MRARIQGSSIVVSLNSRLESNNEEVKGGHRTAAGAEDVLAVDRTAAHVPCQVQGLLKIKDTHLPRVLR